MSPSPVRTRKASLQPDYVNELKQLIKASKSEIINSVRQDINNLNEKLESLNVRFSVLESSLVNVKRDQEKLKSDLVSVKTEMTTLIDHSFKSSMTEIDNRTMRLNNIIVRGLPERLGTVEERLASDTGAVQQLLKTLDVVGVSLCDVKRLGKPLKDHPRLLRIALPSVTLKQEVLRRSKTLKNSSFNNVFIQNDLTPLQQERERTLRKELRERQAAGEDVVISNGTVRSLSSPGFRRRF